MTTNLRVVLDQIVTPTDATLAMASRELTRALVRTAPSGCAVEGIVPAATDAAAAIEAAVPGLVDLTRTALPRRELAAAWQLGVAPGLGGLIHSPSMLAPLVKHDRVHDHDQIVVTAWDLDAWERPGELARGAVTWHKAMLKRAVKHADAVVVPTHAAAERLGELGAFGDRIRVIAGAAPAAFAVPTDEIGRRRALNLPDGFVLVAGSSAASARLDEAFAAIARAGADLPVVVLDAPDGDEPAVVELAEAAGIDAGRVHVRGTLDDADRAAVFGAAVAFVAPSRRTAFPWRVVEALAIGVPVVAADTEMHREVILDGGVFAAASPRDSDGDAGAGAGADAVAGEALGDALAQILGSAAAVERYAVLAGDRGRAFSWLGAAERVWQLHADL
ncbi:MAG: glycosyl transferase [Microbacterium sp. SCN 70-200]|uniref:glycosyltransferase n=1 Tax=unclassified Microbacterium TaxID=2609290 RepID=UPI0008690BB9|nr:MULTISPECIES: glycosyltransferase [unclassified Microbacterium]MBN9213834.1 glycosyltransferase [Microbacterium sp.]ODT42387.1 MAG: glycosyl transferase [Microbacterium sp. SCN 70-200]OJV85485.1 MAG: glycosyl transferase [Microbacterium sp. 70-16]